MHLCSSKWWRKRQSIQLISLSSGPFMSLGVSHHTSWVHFTFFPFTSTLSHLLSHPYSKLMLLPISLNKWKRISIRNLPPHAPPCQHLQRHPLPSTMPHLTHLLCPLDALFWQCPLLSLIAPTLLKFNMSKTELLISHCMFLYLQPSVSQCRTMPSSLSGQKP